MAFTPSFGKKVENPTTTGSGFAPSLGTPSGQGTPLQQHLKRQQESFTSKLSDILSTAIVEGKPLKAAGKALGQGVSNVLDAPGDIKDQFRAGVEQTKQGVSEVLSGSPVEKAEGVLAAGSGTATAITSPFAPILSPIGSLIQAAGEKIGESPSVQAFAESPAGQTTARVAEDLANLGNIAGTAAGVRGSVPIARRVAAKIESSVAPSPVSQSILSNYSAAIKPTVAGKKSPQLLQRYNDNVVSAVESIVGNKENIKFTSFDGGEVTGQLPKTVGEFAQALDQTKAAIFSEYNALTKQATGKGVQVDTQPAIDALKKVTDSEALQLTHPEAINYAQSLMERFAAKGAAPKQLNPDVVQDVIKNYNSSLEAFYRNPSFDNASKAAIEAGVLYQMRQALDNTITKATGEQYGALKKEYAALKAIEDDVSKRAVVLARQSSATGLSGLGDYAAIFSGGDIVSGILSLSPGLVAKGTIQIGLTKLFSYLKSPDRAIQNMFRDADSAAKPPTLPQPTPQPES